MPLKFFRRLRRLLQQLHHAECQRDRARNRRLFFDDLCALILLTFFNPSIKTLRDLQRASRLTAVRRKLGCSRTSLGALSEAMHLFDPQLILPIITQLLGAVPHWPTAECCYILDRRYEVFALFNADRTPCCCTVSAG